MSTNSQSNVAGPSLLEQRSLLGIAVHVIGLFTGIVGPGIVYLVSDHEFTRKNARHALNWHLFYTIFFLVVIALTLGWIVAVELFELLGIPDVVALILFVPVFASVAAGTVLVFLTLVFCLVATIKAIFGDAWSYPIAPDLV